MQNNEENAVTLCPGMARNSLGAVAAASGAAAALWLLPSPPYGAVFTACAALLAAAHLGAWLLYHRFERNPAIFRALVCLSSVLLAGIVSDTGGASSPFVLLFVWIAFYGILCRPAERWVPAAAAGSYLLGAYFNIPALLGLAPSVFRAVYRVPSGETIGAALACGCILFAGAAARRLVKEMNSRLADENSEKAHLLKKFSDLNSSAQIGLIAHRIAHDLRGPIASISGYLEMELALKKSPAEMETLSGLSQTVLNMVETLQGITRFGKPGGVAEEKIHVPDFIRDLLAIASFAPFAKGVKFQVKNVGVDGVCVNASRSELQQAYFNIIKNSIEAVSGNPDAKLISIIISRADKDAQISVSDNGPGIPAEALKNIFRRAVTTKKDGTGVGLLITRDLLMRNSGEIKLKNRAEGGLTVVTSLPLA